MAVDKRIGELLVFSGLLEDAELAPLLLAAKFAGTRVLSLLLERAMASEHALVKLLTEQHSTRGIALETSVLDLALLDFIPRTVAERELVLPILSAGGQLHIAVADPSTEASEELHYVTLLDVVPCLALESSLRQTIGAAYDARERGEQFFRGARAPAGGVGLDLIAAPPGPPPVEIDLSPAFDEGEEVLTSLSVQCGVKRRILVVDDEPDIRELTAFWLESRGYAAGCAAGGQEALALLATESFDLVLLDAMMPGLHGFDVCVRIKALFPGMPVIMMSAVYRGWRFAEDAKESLRADDYLEKPFQLEEVLRKIELYLPRDDVADRRARSLSLYRTGLGQLGSRDYLSAAGTFEESLRADPQSARAHYQLARCLQDGHQVYPAMHHYEQAIDLQPAMFSASRSLAALYLASGFRRKAAGVLECALRTARDASTRRAVRHDLLHLVEGSEGAALLTWPTGPGELPAS